MLVRLVYASRARDASPEAVQGIVASARRHNAGSGITGVLVHGGGVFLQAIEGGRRAVNALYGAILRDARHHDVVLLHYEEIHERRFGGWTMGLVDAARINASVLLKHAERAQLDPYAVPGRASVALLEELAATAAIAAHP